MLESGDCLKKKEWQYIGAMSWIWVIIEIGAMTFKGLHYGKLNLDPEAPQLTLTHQERPLFSLPYQRINNSTVNKQDIIIETINDDLGNEDAMCEIRLHVEEPKEEKEDEGEQMEVEEEGSRPKDNLADQIYKHIVERAKIG